MIAGPLSNKQPETKKRVMSSPAFHFILMRENFFSKKCSSGFMCGSPQPELGHTARPDPLTVKGNETLTPSHHPPRTLNLPLAHESLKTQTQSSLPLRKKGPALWVYDQQYLEQFALLPSYVMASDIVLTVCGNPPVNCIR